MIAKNETALAKTLGVTRACLHDYRRRFDTAPAGRDVEAWEEFLRENGLGDRARGRLHKLTLRTFVEGALLDAELRLGQAQIRLEREGSQAAKRFAVERRKMIKGFAALWEVAETL